MQTLESRLTRIREGAAKRIPPEALAQMHATTRALIDSGLHEGALGEGDLAPAFELQTTGGASVSLDRLLAQGPAVLTFYRGHW